jgi:hypothetical protein
MYDVLKVPMAFTWEIYGDLSAPFEDCFKMFNPVTPDVFKVRVALGAGRSGAAAQRHGSRARPRPRGGTAAGRPAGRLQPALGAAPTNRR